VIEVISRQSKRVKQLAWQPRLQLEGVDHTALLRDVGRAACSSRLTEYIFTQGEENVVVRYVPTATILSDRPALPLVALMALRWDTLILGLFPVMLGLIVTGNARPGLKALIVSASLMMHASANLISEANQHATFDDALLRWGGSRVLERGWVTARQFVVAGAICLVAVILQGVALIALTRSLGFLVLGMLGVIIAWQFSAPPLRLSRNVLGDIVLLLVFGPVLSAGACYAALGRVNTASICAGLIAAALTCLWRVLRDIRRLPDDALVGHYTLAFYSGFKGSKRILSVAVAVLLFGPVFCWLVVGASAKLSVSVLFAPLLAWVLRPAWNARAPHDPAVTRSIRRLSWASYIYAAVLVTAWAL
jgi:1,4-dihydroxy-2-naphthoate octaprenyltransferase